ncbi:MAG: Ig-like domain-containing protein [Clostridiales bacterium]|nr:Ig-like domain-containing protein [Clostridiales bacterium]
MRRKTLVLMLTALFCFSCLGWAQAQEKKVDFEAAFEDMSIDELKATQDILQNVLNDKIVENAKLKLSATEERVAKGKTLKLTVDCDGREITKKTVVEYASSNEEVATVSKGTVKGVKAGETVITATATFEDGGVLTAQYTVEVYEPVSAVKLESQSLTLLIGQTEDLSEAAYVTPETATEQGLRFEVDDPQIASVTSDGVLSAKQTGTAKVTVTSKEPGEKPKSATLQVKVLKPVDSITLDRTEFDVGKGRTYTIACNVGPEDASNPKVVWTSADPAIAKVSSKGVVTGVGTGSTTITCTADDGSGVSATAHVTVITAVKKVAFEDRSLAVTEGNNLSISASVTPEDATNPALKWTSSNTAIASVDENGKVTAKKSGECTITAEAADGSGAKASMTVYVEPKLPIVVSSIYWQTTWGWKNGRMGVEADNLCISRKIKSFDYTVKCYNYNSDTPIISYMSYDGSSISPGKTGKSKLSDGSVGGFTNAYRIEITPTCVYYSNGTMELIDDEDQYTSSFSM